MNELSLESLTEIPDAPAQTMERPSHNPRELPRSVRSQVPLPGAVTHSRRLHTPFPFRRFMFEHEAPCSLDICRGVTALQLDNMALQAAAV